MKCTKNGFANLSPDHGTQTQSVGNGTLAPIFLLIDSFFAAGKAVCWMVRPVIDGQLVQVVDRLGICRTHLIDAILAEFT